MGKVEVNNEVILIRPFVRKAKVRIVRNLIREIKILRVKRGDEKKLTKFKRRADRLTEEVEAAKKIKDDDVTKFGISNTKSLYSILDDPTSDAHTRVIAKFADFQELKQRIVEFKTKFPDYEQFIGPGRKKLAKQQMKAALKEAKKGEKAKEIDEESNDKRKKKPKNVERSDSDDEEKEESDEEMEADSDQFDEEEQFIVPGKKKLAKQQMKAARKETKKPRIVEMDDSDDEEMEADSDQVDEEEQSIVPGKKKLAKQQIKAALKETKKPRKVEMGDSDDEEMEADSDQVDEEEEKESEEDDEEVEIESSEEIEEDNSDEMEDDDDIETPEPSFKLKNTGRSKRQPKNATSESETDVEEEPVAKKVSKKVAKTLKKEKVNKNRILNAKEIQAVSKEATVKRFTELLKEEEERKAFKEKDSESKTETVELEKEVDSFFLTADGSKEYLCVIPQKKDGTVKSTKDDIEDDNSDQDVNFSKNKRDRSFSNLNKFEESSDKFKRRSNKFEGRSDKFERRPGKFSKNKKEGFDTAPKFGPRNEKGNKGNKSVEKLGNKFEKKSKNLEDHLHPSWAAKKKQQDALKLGFQGKKIVFDN